MTLYHLNVTVHLLAALFWLGGMFFLGAVGAPVLRGLEDARLRARLFEEIGRRFRRTGWWAIGILLVTGILNLHFRGLLRADVLGAGDFWTGRYGRMLAWKLAGVGTMVAVSFAHDFVLGPAAARAAREGRTDARRRAAWLARLNALVGVGVVVAAVRLARGG